MERSEDSVVSIATGSGLDGQEFESQQVLQIFPSPKQPRPGMRHTQPPIEWVPVSFTGCKVAGV
jgi:hypothetical protein